MELVCSFSFEKFPTLSGFRYELGLIVGNSEVVVVVEYFQLIGFFAAKGGVLNGLSNFLYGCLDFEVVGGNLWKLLVLFSEALTKMDFKEEIQFKLERVVHPVSIFFLFSLELDLNLLMQRS